MSTDTLNHYRQYLLGNYAAPALTLSRGEGLYVWDDQGRRYLDFGTGIAVNALGHAHPAWVQAISSQLGQLGHVSNLYAHQGQAELARRLVGKAGDGKVLFCNSGAEANEALLKLARLHGASLAGKEGVRYKVICAENAFHGRTFGGMAATPQEKIQGGFRPMLPGFAFGKLNDLASFEALIDDQTAAIFVETIQGEGGLHACTPAFLQGLRTLCDQHKLLLMIDEVQCGIGRSGTFFAFEQAGIRPDAIGMAKGLAGGFPMGAIWVADAYASLFKPGSHGTTFGGSPPACAAALAVLDILEKDQLVEKVARQAPEWHEALAKLVQSFPQRLLEVRGTGYMTGLAMREDHLPWVTRIREAGMLVVPAGGQVIRLLPPLIAEPEHLRECIHILESVFSSNP